jgi:hypothetical protein
MFKTIHLFPSEFCASTVINCSSKADFAAAGT